MRCVGEIDDSNSDGIDIGDGAGGCHIIRMCDNSWNLIGPVSVFGYALERECLFGDRLIAPKDFFCAGIPAGKQLPVSARGVALLILQPGYVGHPFMQGAVDLERGHVKYIDGCTDSLLVCPPRLGEPCLNALYFPPGVNQSFHTHPSLRAGIVATGGGVAHFGEQGAERELPLVPGRVFYLPAGERHRFRTRDQAMVVIAYHPDSTFGPTDEDHPMINATVLCEATA